VTGAAVSVLAANLLLAPLSYMRGQRHLRWPVPKRLLALSAAALLLLAGLHALLPSPTNLTQLALGFTLYALFYIACCAAGIGLLRKFFMRETDFLTMLVQRRPCAS
jgi:MFS family permease